jgi:hypothetical protein
MHSATIDAVARLAFPVALLVLLAGCGESSSQPPRQADVARALREWVGSFRAEDADRLCSRTFMAYDVGRRLWSRIGLEGSRTSGRVVRTASAARVRRDCLDTYGDGLRTLAGEPRIVRMGRIVIEAPVRGGGGITRTARADLTVRYRTAAGPETRPWPARLVLYRGRWRVLQGYG